MNFLFSISVGVAVTIFSGSIYYLLLTKTDFLLKKSKNTTTTDISDDAADEDLQKVRKMICVIGLFFFISIPLLIYFITNLNNADPQGSVGLIIFLEILIFIALFPSYKAYFKGKKLKQIENYFDGNRKFMRKGFLFVNLGLVVAYIINYFYSPRLAMIMGALICGLYLISLLIFSLLKKVKQ